MECFSVKMCGRRVWNANGLKTGVWLWCVYDECFGIINPSACTVRELERVHQWVSYRDDVFLYDHLVGILTTWLRPVSKPKLNCGLPALTKSGKQSKEHRP